MRVLPLGTYLLSLRNYPTHIHMPKDAITTRRMCACALSHAASPVLFMARNWPVNLLAVVEVMGAVAGLVSETICAKYAHEGARKYRDA